MANVYVRSGAGGAGTGADWANAFTTLAAALTAKAAGDIFFVSEDHAETQASAMTLTSPGTAASPCKVICANHAGSVPPVSADLATTGTISTTGASNITLAGLVSVCYGITFSVADSTSAAAFVGGFWNLDNCVVKNAGNSSAGTIRPTATNGRANWSRTSVQFANAGQSIQLTTGIFNWKNTPTAIGGATLPTNFFNANCIGDVFLEGVDLSALSAKTLVAPSTTMFRAVFADCKLPASVTPTGTLTSPIGPTLTLARCDSGATNYRTERYAYEGSQVMETTVVRGGGASDGTTSVAWKIVTTANSKFEQPFTSIPISEWNDVTASNVVVTVFGIWATGAVPNNDDIWIEVEYLGSSSTPQGSFASTAKADVLAAGAAVSSDGSTWGGSTTPFKMVATLSAPQPGLKGRLKVRVKAAKASTTFFIDPKVVLS